MDTLATRQPIFDRREQLFGYDLIVRRVGRVTTEAGSPGTRAEIDTISDVGVDRIAAGHQVFVNVDRAMLLAGAAESLPIDRVILQIRPRPGANAAWIHSCAELAQAGFRMSIVTSRPQELPDELLRFADFVKIEVAGVDRARLSDMVARLRGFKVRLVASRVRHRIERDICTNLGFELFEGFRFSGPARLTRNDVPVECLRTFRLLKMLHDPNATDSEIEDTLRRDVALSYKLFRMVNSGAVGGRDVWSIGHALRLLGRDQVARWLVLLLVTDRARPGVQGQLVTVALTRARMCELVANASGAPRARMPMFMVGMLSVLDLLLETPMDTIVEAMDLAPDVRAALLRRGECYGTMLDLAEAYEQGTWERVESITRTLGIETETLLLYYLDALAWASEHQGPRSEVTRPVTPPSGRRESLADSAHSTQVARLR